MSSMNFIWLGLRTSLWYSAESVAVKNISFICVLYCIISLISRSFLYTITLFPFCTLLYFISYWRVWVPLTTVGSFLSPYKCRTTKLQLCRKSRSWALSCFTPVCWLFICAFFLSANLKTGTAFALFFLSLFHKIVNVDHYLKAI